MKWMCIVCEKELEVLSAPSPPINEKATFPNIEGGTIEIHFGFGSIYDGINSVKHHSCICDNCWGKKKHLTRAVEEEKRIIWKELPAN